MGVDTAEEAKGFRGKNRRFGEGVLKQIDGPDVIQGDMNLKTENYAFNT